MKLNQINLCHKKVLVTAADTRVISTNLQVTPKPNWCHSLFWLFDLPCNLQITIIKLIFQEQISSTTESKMIIHGSKKSESRRQD